MGIVSRAKSQKKLAGEIPANILRCLSLVMLCLAVNNLVGRIPMEFQSLLKLQFIFLYSNHLTGEIPSFLGNFSALQKLYAAGNSFRRNIPPSLNFLKSIEVLDFSRNILTGKIPEYLESLLFFQTLDLSFNYFEGEVPLGGVFQNASAVSVVGNSKLFGGVVQLQLPKCDIKAAFKNHGISQVLKLAAPIFGGMLVLILVLFSVFAYKGRHTNKVSYSLPTDLTRDIFPKVSYESLYRATDGFSSASSIGSGKLGSVYTGILDEIETVVAVKILDLKVRGPSKSFVAV
ncbi:unnamed protein product [Ilex paraguariensis]|uniref:Uncharacterized protein n=1 Tax=Ilex paraguariensis TaxID=185542 RepID=A0ABC8UPI9_9AQUA